MASWLLPDVFIFYFPPKKSTLSTHKPQVLQAEPPLHLYLEKLLKILKIWGKNPKRWLKKFHILILKAPQNLE